MSDKSKKQAMICQLELMEKEIVYLKGENRVRAKRAYYRLLQSCGSSCGLDEPIYLDRI